MIQHEDYIEALKECGLEVTIMEADEKFPDSCFTEDAALMTPNVAILSNPGAATRNGEKEAMLPEILKMYENIETI
jgi:dimethylargininase